jgi:hypothetical protein
VSQAIAALNYSLFYPGRKLPEQPLGLIIGYNIEEVILTMVALRNSLERNRYDFLRDSLVLSIINKLPANKAQRLRNFLARDQGFGLVHGVVITKILVDLFKALGLNNPTLDIGEGDYEEKLFDLILVYNEYHYSNLLDDGAPDTHELVWALMMMQTISGMGEVNYARTGSIKHLIFLQFLKESLGRDFKKLEDSLKENVGLSTVYQFLGIFITLFYHVTKKNEPTLLLPQISDEDPNYPYLALMNLVIDKELATNRNFDIGTLLTHPFFKTSDGKTYLLDHKDFSLLSERVFIYLLYSKTNILNLINKKDLNGLLAHIGLNYYEKYLLHRLLKSLERPGLRVVASEDQLLSDFTMIVNETDVFVIEVKSVAMNYRVFVQQNHHGFKKYIDDKFCDEKGVPQLARNIGYLRADRANLLNLRKPANKLNIYPIIVFTEPQISTYAVNDYVGEKANLEFEKLAGDFKEIRPLTMIHSDFFVENIELLNRDRALLKKLINDYHASNYRKRQRYNKFKSTENYVRSMVDFDRYAIGKKGVYRVDQKKIFEHLTSVFRLKQNPEEKAS